MNFLNRRSDKHRIVYEQGIRQLPSTRHQYEINIKTKYRELNQRYILQIYHRNSISKQDDKF